MVGHRLASSLPGHLCVQQPLWSHLLIQQLHSNQAGLLPGGMQRPGAQAWHGLAHQMAANAVVLLACMPFAAAPHKVCRATALFPPAAQPCMNREPANAVETGGPVAALVAVGYALSRTCTAACPSIPRRCLRHAVAVPEPPMRTRAAAAGWVVSALQVGIHCTDVEAALPGATPLVAAEIGTLTCYGANLESHRGSSMRSLAPLPPGLSGHPCCAPHACWPFPGRLPAVFLKGSIVACSAGNAVAGGCGE